jgi:hypothetical protein
MPSTLDQPERHLGQDRGLEQSSLSAANRAESVSTLWRQRVGAPSHVGRAAWPHLQGSRDRADGRRGPYYSLFLC